MGLNLALPQKTSARAMKLSYPAARGIGFEVFHPRGCATGSGTLRDVMSRAHVNRSIHRMCLLEVAQEGVAASKKILIARTCYFDSRGVACTR